jgi:hypothetical protein
MFSGVPERKMRVTRTVLLVLWLVLISSLFYDPWTPALTRPDNLASPFHLVLSNPVIVQGKALQSAPYPMGARIFWTMLIPIVPMLLMLFGHEAWRRICPLSMSTQLAQYLGVQSKSRFFNRKSGQVEKKTRLLKAESFLARHVWFVQFGLLWAGITGRLLFMNSDRTFLACFLLGIIGAAALVGLFFGGKTWCNFFCPISPVQKIYTGPGGLLESKAYRAKGISQSMCRKRTLGGDQSTCVGCASSCPDIDLERFYWDSLFRPGKRFAYYGYFGLVAGFYGYYYLYAGNWNYYFSGAWTHEAGQLARLFSPGFYLGGTPVPIPKLLAAPLTTGLSVLLAYILGAALENAYGSLRGILGKPLIPEARRHHAMSFSAFLTFNVFYLFGGRPNLNLLPSGILKAVDVLIVAASTLWLSTTLRCGHAIYRRESLAQNMLRQLKKLKQDFAAILEGRTLDELNADEIYILARTITGLSDEKKEVLYQNVLREALARGEISSETGLEAMREIRQQMNISEEDHNLIMGNLLRQLQAIGSTSVGDPARLRLNNFALAMESVVRRCLETGNPLREELAARENDREVRKLRSVFDISDAEHEEILSVILCDSNLAIREARSLLEEIAETALHVKSLSGPDTISRSSGVELLTHHLERRHRFLEAKFLGVMATLPRDNDTVELVRWFNVTLAGQPWECPDAFDRDSPESRKERVPSCFLDILHEDAGRSMEALDADKGSEYAALRALLTSRPDPRKYLVQTARGSEPVQAAVALFVLNQVDPDQAKTLAAGSPSRETQHWLLNEVTSSINGTNTNGSGEPRDHPEDGDGVEFEIERADTVRKMLHLHKSAFFKHLGLDILASISRDAVVRLYNRGAVICRLGEKSDRIFVICQGSADVSIERNGSYKWVNAVGEGDSIGELGVFTKRPRSATVRVNRDNTRLISISDGALMAVLNQNAKASISFLELLSVRQQAMLAKM